MRVDSLSVSGVPTPRRGARDRVWKNTGAAPNKTHRKKGPPPPASAPPPSCRPPPHPNHGVARRRRSPYCYARTSAQCHGWLAGWRSTRRCGLILAGPFARWDAEAVLCSARAIQRMAHLEGSRGVTVDTRYVHTKRRSTVPLFHFQYPGAEVTLLWSQSAKCDGRWRDVFFFLSLPRG